MIFSLYCLLNETIDTERKSATKKPPQDENKYRQSRPKTNESASKKPKIKETVTAQPQELHLKEIGGAKMQEIEGVYLSYKNRLRGNSND